MSQESEWRYKILNQIDFQNLSFSRWKSLIWWKEYLVTCAVYDQLGICYTLYLYFIFVFELFWNVYSNISMFDIFYSTKCVWPSCLFPVQQQRSSKLVTHIVRNCESESESDTHCKKLWDQNGKTWKQICYFGNPYKVVFFCGFLWQKISDQTKRYIYIQFWVF